MKSNITLYYKSLVNKEKNFVLDNPDGSSSLSTYLSTLQSETINNFQYIKQGLSVSIKLNKNQIALEMIDSKDLNYVKIQNFDVVNEQEVLEKPYFYFVISKIWRSKETIELVLSMDTLNTFRFNSDYVINVKTLTKRMHKDRFKNYYYMMEIKITLTGTGSIQLSDGDSIKFTYGNVSWTGRVLGNTEIILGTPTSIYLDIESLDKIDIIEFNNYIEDGVYFDEVKILNVLYTDVYVELVQGWRDYQFQVREIDLKSEDIACPVYKKRENKLYEQRGTFLNTWVLYYKNATTQENSPIDCYLASDEELTFLTETGSNTITASNIPSGKMLFLSPQMSGDITISVDGVNYRCYEQPNFSGNVSGYYCIVIVNNNGVLTFNRYVYTRMSTSYIRWDNYTITITNPTTIQVESSITTLSGREDTPPASSSYSSYSWDTNPFNPNAVNKTLTLSPLTDRIIASADTIDKTLQENIKIINIPYSPSTITEENGKYVIGSLWKYDAIYRFFKLTDFNQRFENYIVTDEENILNYFISEPWVRTTARRFVDDSKLYHSDYFRPKFVYDSFNKIFPLEQIDFYSSMYKNKTSTFDFKFVMTRNIVSKFLFQFDYVYKNSNQDYENIVAVARNNEEVLYNSSYLNYIRTGYNYDLKSKERSEVASGVGIGLSAFGLTLTGIIGAATGNPLAVGAAIGAGIGLASSLVNQAKTVAQNEENIQRKLTETNRQAVAVMNADDYDLLYAYSQNKAKLCYYAISDEMKQVLNDLFYYAGYVVNKQMIPNINSRYWFNFVQASLVINDSSNLTNEIEDDIKEKFEQGVTFLHYHDKFDFNQEMENWETSLLE